MKQLKEDQLIWESYTAYDDLMIVPHTPGTSRLYINSDIMNDFINTGVVIKVSIYTHWAAPAFPNIGINIDFSSGRYVISPSQSITISTENDEIADVVETYKQMKQLARTLHNKHNLDLNV